MKRKRILYLLLISVIIILSVILVRVASSFHDYKNALQFPAYEEIHVTIKQYETGMDIDIQNREDIMLFLESLGNVEYAGIYKNRLPITPSDNAFSISISSKNYFHIFVIAQNEDLNYLYGNKFEIKLKNYDKALAFLNDYFEQNEYQITD